MVIGANEHEKVDDQTFVATLRKNIFGLSSESPAVNSAEFYDKIFSESNMESLSKKAVTLLKENIPDLITFNESFVDQQAWERASLTTLVEHPDSEKDLSESTLECV